MPKFEREQRAETVGRKRTAPVVERAVPVGMRAAPLGDNERVVAALAGGSVASRAAVVTYLQRTIGNEAVTRMLARDMTAADAQQTTEPPLETGIADKASTGRITAGAKKLAAGWDSLKTAEERAKVLAGGALAELKAAGVPEYSIVLKDLGKNTGQFQFTTWVMELHKARFEVAKPSAEHLAGVARTIAHESRHCEQWFRMARLEAGRGKDAKVIAREMGIPKKIAEAALKSPLKADGPEGKEADAWYESVYGGKSAARRKILKDLPVLTKAYNDAKAENERVSKSTSASQTEKKVAQRKQAEAKKAYDECYAKYRALPEEADAWKVGEAVERGVKKP
jgi:hypothetical protein